MKIGSVLENQNLEKRIAITPELVKKYTSLGFEVNLIENYGSHLGIKDEQFKDLGAKILMDETEILKSSDVIVQLGMLSDDKISKIKANWTAESFSAKTISYIKETVKNEKIILIMATSNAPKISIFKNTGAIFG